MIYFKHDGDKIHNGITFYPLTSMTSFGFRLRWRENIWRVRYSKVAKKWFIGKSGI
jgi:hypothetical protein